MIAVNFVCLGNICRSPMAELVFKKLVNDAGLALSFDITSCATSSYEVGNPVYPPAKRTLERHGISGEHRSRQITKRDIINSDYLLVMDGGNLMDVLRMAGAEYGGKVYKLCSFTDNPRDVADPWYTGDFEKAYADIYDGCKSFLEYIIKENREALSYDKRH